MNKVEFNEFCFIKTKNNSLTIQILDHLPVQNYPHFPLRGKVGQELTCLLLAKVNTNQS